MNKPIQKSGAVFVMAIFAFSLVFPSFVLAEAGTDTGSVITFVPEIYKSSNSKENKGNASFKGLTDLSDDTTYGNMWFEWGETSSLDKRTTSYSIGSTEVLMYHYLSGLDINDFYYYRAVAQESDGEFIYGSTVRFRIIDGYAESLGTVISNVGTIIDTTSSYPAPTVTTMIPQIVNTTTAVIKGEAQTNTSINTNVYFRWGTTPDITSQTPLKGIGAGVLGTSFSEVLTGLTPGTVYYYRAEVIGPGGRAVGSILAFTTDRGLITGFNQPLSTTPTYYPLPTNTTTQANSAGTGRVANTPRATGGVSQVTNSTSDVGTVTNTSSGGEATGTSKETTNKGFWATFFGSGDDETSTTETDTSLQDTSGAQTNGQNALVASKGGFFPNTVFGWILLTILIVLLVALFVYVQIMNEQIKTLREERERSRNGNGFGGVHNNH